MTTTTLHPCAADYLDRLERAARRLPRGERRELVQDIRAHLSEAIDPDMSDAEALNVLDRLGDPDDIVDAELQDESAEHPGPHFQEWAAIFLLLFGGFIFVFGWFAGALLLWMSRRWSLRDKLIGTFVVPGGLASVFVGVVVTSSTQSCYSVGAATHCTGGASTLQNILGAALLALLLAGPIFTAVYLARRAT